MRISGKDIRNPVIYQRISDFICKNIADASSVRKSGISKRNRSFNIYPVHYIDSMKILLAEYAVGAGIEEFMLEGKAMLDTLVKSFVSCGHDVLYPSGGYKT